MNGAIRQASCPGVCLEVVRVLSAPRGPDAWRTVLVIKATSSDRLQYEMEHESATTAATQTSQDEQLDEDQPDRCLQATRSNRTSPSEQDARPLEESYHQRPDRLHP
ncbi:hypothetical protein DPEC_G00335790 [Dallia pectoralis]|uniref:Uncharacterized protein n=1 Tax=Dallia pectoralis TaxID=75939 RepID=A0ACC2F774_DALPE|nr:hypothetical protein DPEC_G00335790 [Dallia pectoralis]